MTVYFTSDSHLSHKNIIKYCDRPFKDVDHMDAEIIRRWNETVTPDDEVYHLGDIALGPIDKSLAKITQLNGYKIAIMGNHDRPFMRQGKPDESDWFIKYGEVFDELWDWRGGSIDLYGQEFNLSHFPYTGDSHDGDRYDQFRFNDQGVPIIHGHTHSKEKISYSSKGTLQIHVGQDAWGYRPVPEDAILDLLKGG